MLTGSHKCGIMLGDSATGTPASHPPPSGFFHGRRMGIGTKHSIRWMIVLLLGVFLIPVVSVLASWLAR